MDILAERRESVRLELIDSGFSTGMVKSAAATGLLEKALKSLDGTNVVIHERISESATQVDRLSKSSQGADRSINQLTGRLRLFADAAAILGPALVPIGGVLTAGIAGFASQLGFAAIAGGVLVGSMQGVGDALEALNDAQLEPTAENLTKAKDALNALSPAAATFAQEANGLLPVLRGIRDAGAEGLFPGLTESLDDLERLAPVVANIFNRIGGAVGDIAADSAASLASDRWADFFDFIATEGPRALSEMATAVGDVTHGLAELWMAFAPLNSDMSGWLMDVADGFDSWASGLAQTDSFREFVDYIRETGPQVSETFGALANAVVQIVQAAAPLGGPVLQAIEGFADALAFVADSNVGSSLIAAAAGFAAVSRAMMLFNAAKSTALVGMMTDLSKNGEQAGKGARALGVGLGSLLAIPALDAAQTQFEGLSTGLNALSKELVTLGSSGSLSGEFDNLTESLTRLSDPNLAQGLQDSIYNALPFLGSDSRVDEATAQFEALDAALVNIANTQGGAAAETTFQNLAASMGLTADQTKDLLELLPGYRDAIVQVADAAESASNSSLYDSLQAESAALEKNIGLMQAKRDAALRGFSAQTDYSQSLLDAKKALEENGRAWGLNSEAGLKNRRVVEQQAASWNQLNREQGQTPAQARKARAALEDTAVSLGATKEEAKRYARQLMDIPNQLETKIGLDVDTAMQRAKAIKSELASIDRSIDIYVNIRRPNAGGFGPQIVEADGGVLDFYADGGMAENHTAQIAPAGAWRVWAEPETGGEAYIPLAPAKRERSIDIWEQVGSRLGVQFERFAAGGISDDDEGDGKKKRRRKNYFDVTDNTKALQASIDRLTEKSADQTAATEAQRDALEQATEATEMWADRMADVAKGTVSGFNTGLFDRDSNVWAEGSGGGPISNLTKDIGGLEERAGLQAQLAGMGLSGDALAALLSEGDNADIQALIDSGQVGQYAELFNQRAALQGSVGAAAGEQAFGKEYAAARAYEEKQFGALQDQLATQKRTEARIGGLEAQIARTNTLMERLNNDAPERTGREVGKVINEGAASAHREGRWRNG